jgi:hypothetical protein
MRRELDGRMGTNYVPSRVHGQGSREYLADMVKETIEDQWMWRLIEYVLVVEETGRRLKGKVEQKRASERASRRKKSTVLLVWPDWES